MKNGSGPACRVERCVYMAPCGAQVHTDWPVMAIGRFNEAGLLEWMRFVIFRARSRSTLPGRFLSRRCFTLCVTVEVEPRIAKQYKYQYCCNCKHYCGKGMEGGKKSVFALFFGWPEDCEFVLVHPIARTSYCLLPDTLWLRAYKNAFKIGSVKSANSLSLPSIVKKVHTGRKSSQGT